MRRVVSGHEVVMGTWQAQTFFKKRAEGALPRAHRPRFTDSHEDDQWAGRRVFIVGGGPSLNGLDLARLEGELVLGINMAFRALACTINFFGSVMLMQSIQNEPDFQLLDNKCCLEAMVWNTKTAFGCQVIEAADKREMAYGYGLRTGIPVFTNSGMIALNLADILGAEEIYLLGFDMNARKDGRTQNWHTWYKDSITPKNDRYRDYIEEFERTVPFVRAKVFNCSHASRLQCFPTADYHELF